MKSRSISEWNSLEYTHKDDPMILFPSKKINSVDGLKVSVPVFYDKIQNINSDKYSKLCLTDVTKLNDLIKLSVPISRYPEQFTTSLLCNAYPTITNSSAYLFLIEQSFSGSTRAFTIGEDASAMSWIWVQDISSNSIYFTVTLHDELTLSINHNDNVDNVFLSYDADNHSIVFKTVDFNVPTENEIFNYFINKDQGFILLYKQIDDTIYYLKPNVQNNTILLESASSTNSTTLPLYNVFKYVKYNKNSLTHNLANNWVSYQTSGDFNNLNINDTKSYFDVTNNYLIDYQYSNIDKNGNVPVGVTQLKNQITITGDTNRENPFPNMRDCDHREYTSIQTSDDISGLNLGYESYETEVVLPPDSITYFNTPQVMFPYTKLNINDSGLIRRGAIGGDTPLTSDKIFKKAATYKYNTPHGKPTDEESGVWLCSWLKSNLSTDWESGITYNENVFVSWEDVVYKCLIQNKGRRPDTNSAYWQRTERPPPVWVDRYYNPEKYTVLEAMKVEGQYTNYKPKFDHIVESLEAKDSYVFDKISDLTFEPGCLYAYYRVGKQHISTIIDNISDSLLHEGLEPLFLQDRSTYVNTDPDKITFTGEQYIESTRNSDFSENDFTISFNMSVDDWSTPIGSQIIGNYTNHGVGIFNKQETTPYTIFKSDSDVVICNINCEVVSTLIDEAGVVDVTKQLGNEDIVIYNSLSANTYDMKGMLVETFTPAGYITYRNEIKEVYITATKPGIPEGVFRLYSDWTSSVNIVTIVSGWNTNNPDFPVVLTGAGAEWTYDDNGNVLSSPWIPEQDIVVEPDQLESPAGRIVAADIDNNFKYVLDEYDSIYRFDLNTEQYDLLNKPYPYNTILGVGEVELSTGEIINLQTSNNKFIKSADNGVLQYILDCDTFTIDMFDQPWFVKHNVVYKYTLSEQLGINASWQGAIQTEDWTQGGEALLVASNNFNGSVGNLIKLHPDGVKTLNGLVSEWNDQNKNNTVNIVEGDSSMIPVQYLPTGDPFIIELTGGVDRGSTTTSMSFSASDEIHNIKCDHDNNFYLLVGNRVVKTDYLRNIISDIDLSSILQDIDISQVSQQCMDLQTYFDENNTFITCVLILLRINNTDDVNVLKFNSEDMSLISNTVTTLTQTINLNNQHNITGFETNKQLCRDVLDSNYLTFQIRYQSYFDTDKTSVKKLTVDVSDFTPGTHHFVFAYNSNNSNLSLFIDGVLSVAESSDDSASGAAYKFSKTIQSPILVGAEPFFNNITFSEHVNLQNYGFSSGFSISNYRLFTEYLNFQRIKMLSREGKEIQPLKITLPSGKRNYIEHADRFYSHMEPGDRSNIFDITIANQSLTATDLQQLINVELVENIKDFLPANVSINNIDWIT